MEKALITREANWTPDQIALLKNTVCKNATDDEFKIFCYAVNRTGLDPFMKQIHAVKRWNNKTGREDMSIQVGIDGYRLIADRTGNYAGSDDTLFDNDKKPKKATVTVYKMVQGHRCAFTATARWSEYYPGDKQGFMWNKMPCVMLGKVAEALALRKAFPAELSGIYTNEEMEQADKTLPNEQNAIPVQSSPIIPTNPAIETQKALISQNKANDTESDQRNKLGKKISILREQLEMSAEELREKVYLEFKKDKPQDLTIPELLKVVSLLEEIKLGRQKVEESEDDDLPPAPWMEDLNQMKPIPS